MKHKVGIVSLGCDKNLVDTENMLGLISQKYALTVNEEDADILIVNTCAFIESAKQESINTILELADYKTDGKCKVLIVTGCMAQRYKDEILKEMPEVDAVVGTGSYHEIVDVIDEVLNKVKVKRFSDINTICEYDNRVMTTPQYTAYLKIAEGCSNNCTYCIIPKIRGKYRSRKMEDILKEADKLAKNGVKELIIIAQDTTKYGVDSYKKPMLPELLNNLCNIEGLHWIRLLYCYPEGISDQLIEVIKNQPKICKYLDIPMQHCNNDILKLMGRRSSKENIVDLINKLRKEIPNIAVRTSLIVGFPGETDSQYQELLQFLKEMKLDRVGAFTYSQEEDTKASLFDKQISQKIKERRLEQLMQLQQEISYQKNNKSLNMTYEVLVEEMYDDEFYIGRTYMDSPDVDGLVYMHSKNVLVPGQFVNVKITEINDYDLTGDVLDELG